MLVEGSEVRSSISMHLKRVHIVDSVLQPGFRTTGPVKKRCRCSGLKRGSIWRRSFCLLSPLLTGSSSSSAQVFRTRVPCDSLREGPDDTMARAFHLSVLPLLCHTILMLLLVLAPLFYRLHLYRLFSLCSKKI